MFLCKNNQNYNHRLLAGVLNCHSIQNDKNLETKTQSNVFPEDAGDLYYIQKRKDMKSQYLVMYLQSKQSQSMIRDTTLSNGTKKLICIHALVYLTSLERSTSINAGNSA